MACSVEAVHAHTAVTSVSATYAWLNLPVLDRTGHIRHDGGATQQPGLYVLGTRFLRRRKSSFIDGVGEDARDLSIHLDSYLAGRSGLQEDCRAASAP